MAKKEMIYVIPDTQVREGVKNPLIAVAHHICRLKPTLVIHLGDHWDMPSLSKYDKGKKSHEVKTYKKDIDAGNKAMREFWEIIHSRWPTAHDDCQFVILWGNHEQRIKNAIEYGPHNLIDLIAAYQPDYSNWDNVYYFLKVFKYKGIEFCHYFQNLHSAYAISSAKLMLDKGHVSRIAGHKQVFDYAEQSQGADKMIQAMIVGSCYYHDEAYKAHTNNHFRGTVVLTNIRDGQFDFARFNLELLDRIFCK